MRFPIHGLFLAASLAAPILAGAALCDETYYLQSIAQTVWEGTDAKALQLKDAKTVSANLSNLQVLDNVMRYSIITGFEGACSKESKPVNLKVKPNTAAAFKDSVDNGYMAQMFDTNSLIANGPRFDYWFGFFKPAATLKFYLGRTNSQGPAFVGWYVGIYYSDSTKDTSGIWKSLGHYYDLQGPNDSADLEKLVLNETIRKLPANGATYRAHYRVQFLKVSYESKVPNKVIGAKPRMADGFRARQTGNLVLMQIGEKSLEGQPLGLYGMLGNKIATLHPTGSLYQWNGRTAAGADAPTGVYFVQAGNRTLGKFFFAR